MAPDGTALRELLALAERTAREAGALIHDGRPSRVEVAATKSSPTDVVTAMDTASEALILERLTAARPQDGFLGEETGHRAGTSGLTWVVDPIDGTVNYLYGIRAYAVSIALVLDPVRGASEPDPASWQPLVGCVHDPAGAETWTAVRGGGAHLDGRALHAEDGPELAGALVATGFGYDAARRAEQAAVVARLLPRVRDLRRIGTASLDLCAVAAGRVDAYYERGLKPWDFAAALLVATEAGAVVTGFTGGAPGGEGLLAAGPALHPEVLAALAS
ncbi:inositol monophosphatase [Kineosporiaceae bacterium B12]|nr:inositol monophosphatase [Kineococcus rubinsiae]